MTAVLFQIYVRDDAKIGRVVVACHLLYNYMPGRGTKGPPLSSGVIKRGRDASPFPNPQSLDTLSPALIGVAQLRHLHSPNGLTIQETVALSVGQMPWLRTRNVKNYFSTF